MIRIKELENDMSKQELVRNEMVKAMKEKDKEKKIH